MCPLSLSRWFSRSLLLVLLTTFVIAIKPAQAQTRAAEKTGKADKADEKVEWLTDAEGRTYRLDPLPKSQGVKIAPDRVRTMWGVQADLAKEDDQFFYIKLYKVDPPPAAPTPETKRRATASPAPMKMEPLPRVSQRLRWTTISNGLPTSGQWREGIALADINGSGHPQIIVSPARKTLRPPSVFEYDASGGIWKRMAGVQFPDRPYDYGTLAVGDLNRDGKPDIVLGEHLRGLIAMLGGGDGKFADASTGLPFITRPEAPAFSSRAIVLGDCNGDGRLDIVALGEGPRLPTAQKGDYAVATGIMAFVQQEDGSWVTKPQADHPTPELFGSSIALGDLDEDGKLDLAIAPGVLGETKVVYRGDGACGWEPEAVDAVRPRSYVTAVAVLETGSKPDAVVLGYTNFETDDPFFGIDLLSRDKEGHWSRHALAREPGRGRVEAIRTGDLDGDGKADIAMLTNEGDVAILLNDGHGGFTREEQKLESTGRCGGASLAIGDLDRDGLNDLVIEYSQEASPMEPGVCASEGAIVAWKTQHRVPATASKPTRTRTRTPR